MKRNIVVQSRRSSGVRLGKELGIGISDTVQVGLLGLATTSSVIIGAALGLCVNFSRKLLACILAFAAGSLIAALAIEPGFESARRPALP